MGPEPRSSRLSEHATSRSATVHAMATPRSRQSARLRAGRRRAQRRARRLALLAVVSLLGVVTLLLTAFGSGSPARQEATAAPSPAPVGTSTPGPLALATVSNVKLQLPVPESAVTAIGYHGTRNGALALHPLGHQANEGLLARLWHRIVGNRLDAPVWYQLGEPQTQVLDVGAAVGTDVYAPVDGTLVAIRDQVVDGRVVGARIDIRPTLAPSVIVSLSHLLADPSLSVGSSVMAAASKLGTVAEVSALERQALSRFTNDAGDNVAIEVHPAATSLP
jgi:hypothetical protein